MGIRILKFRPSNRSSRSTYNPAWNIEHQVLRYSLISIDIICSKEFAALPVIRVDITFRRIVRIQIPSIRKKISHSCSFLFRLSPLPVLIVSLAVLFTTAAQSVTFPFCFPIPPWNLWLWKLIDKLSYNTRSVSLNACFLINYNLMLKL